MKVTSSVILVFFIALFIACSNDDETPNKLNISNPLVYTWNGETYSSTVPDGSNTGKLSGTLTFNKDGSYNSSLSPFQLNYSDGTWDYDSLVEEIIFNKNQENEEIGENAIVSNDSLHFTIFRGSSTSQMVIIFDLSKAKGN